MIENPFLEPPAPEPLHELNDERFTQFTVLPAGGDERDVLGLISPEARSNVRRASRRGVTVEPDNAALAAVYEIHEETMKRFGAPPKSWRFFEEIPKQLRASEDFDVWIARVADELAAALLVIRFNGVSEYFTSGTREGFRDHDPHSALVFAALAHEARRGSRIWNWGGTRHGMDGVFHFKSKWGSRAGRYRYFVRVNDRPLLNASPEELIARFPGFYVLPFAALRTGTA
jgi:lipid II:glycine glycyltransferase (peptidoglycan interpeptide bridge formation enzyme)